MSDGRTRQAAEPVIETQWGRVRGRREGAVYAFRGVRYGADTGGDNRFAPPGDPQPWPGVADATEFGSMAPQSNPDGGAPPYVITAYLPQPEGQPARPQPSESEDCLFLNVWSAGLGAGRRRPVMVYLHGGFFRAGSGAGVDGSRLAERGDVVVVSLNHRLNVLGFSHLDEVGDGSFRHSGNAGMLDIVAALRWVQDNIESFGGDPARVTVFGPSGGGMKTTFLSATPAAAGLLHRASVQSGPALRVMERQAATAVSDRLLHEMGASGAEQLRTAPLERLLSAYHRVAAALPEGDFAEMTNFSPVIDPELMPTHPYAPVATERISRLPLMIGWNREEMAFFKGTDQGVFELSEDDLKHRLALLLGDDAAEAETLYRELHPDYSPAELYLRLSSDHAIMYPTVLQAQRHAAGNGGGTYLYRFDWASPAMDGRLKAFHTLEQHFIFGTTDRQPVVVGTDGSSQALAGTMMNAWASFAADGVPVGGAALPDWPAFSEDRRTQVVFDTVNRLAEDPVQREREFFARRERSYL